MSIYRPACAVAGALLIATGLAACGSSSSTSTNASAAAPATRPGGRARRGFLRDPKVVACLKQEGVTIPSSPRGANAPPGGDSGQSGRPPSGQGRRNRRPDSPQFQKLRAALQKCGVTFPGRPPNGQPAQGQSTTSAS